MSAVLRPFLIYCGLLVVFRMTGKRSLGEITNFDFVLLLIISETVSTALLAHNPSIILALVAVGTLLFVDLLLSMLKQKSALLARWLDDVPVELMRDGKLLEEPLRRERVDLDDILEAARQRHGIYRLEEIWSAVLERRGTISIIPRSSAG